MRFSVLYIALSVLAIATVLLVLTARPAPKKFNSTVTLKAKDKIPYGTYVAYNSLHDLFPFAKVSTTHRAPGFWDELSMDEDRQLFISVSRFFNADTYELKQLLKFIEKGNDAFISAELFSYHTRDLIMAAASDRDLESFSEMHVDPDSMKLKLLKPEPVFYPYDRTDISTVFKTINRKTAEVLGESDRNSPNFIVLRAGKGRLFLHAAPVAFTNYFLLNGHNIEYLEKALSFIPQGMKRVVWDEYYLHKRESLSQRNGKSWLTVLSRYPGFSAALLTAILALAVFVLLEMRRKQRYIPERAKMRNDSLDFVKTIGRLYYEKSDHRNLGRKMSGYFLEYVRTRYKLPTNNLDELFIRALVFRASVPEQLVRDIVTSIRYFEDSSTATADELKTLYNHLSSFYKSA